MINKYRGEVHKLYENIKDEETKALNFRREKVKTIVPRALQIESEIAKLSIELSISIMKNADEAENILKTLKEKITSLRIEKTELLVAHGFPYDYLELHYRCNKCRDTGYIGIEECSCFKPLLVQMYYKDSNLKEILKTNNFNNFSLEYYSSSKTNDNERYSPRKNMQDILEKVKMYIDNFNTTNENFLFYGNSGTGKTFLTNCIAKDLLDKGFLVVYRTAEDLIYNLKDIRFNNNSELEALLLDCDLLIIDDLGSEQINEFSTTELFNLINKKILRKKKMIVSTNFSLERLMQIYSERITSRLFGEFTLNKFYNNDDIRVKKNMLINKTR